MRISRNSKIAVWSVAVAIMSAAIATPAFAEGSRTGTFSDTNPGFASQSWTDRQTDSANTVITWSNCTKTNGTSAPKFQAGLWDQWGAMPDALVGSYRNLGSCASSASSTWYKNSSNYTMRNSTFYWKFGSMNGGWGLVYLNGSFSAKY